MNEIQVEQQGEPPHYDNDLGVDGKKMGSRIRHLVLQGKFPPESLAEVNMIRNFKLSKLTVDEYLAISFPCGSDQPEIESETEPGE
jgi:hypothetical protein